MITLDLDAIEAAVPDDGGADRATTLALVARVRELEAGAAREREARKTDLTPAQRATARARVKAFVAARDGLPVDLDAITEAFAAQVEEAHVERDEAIAREALSAQAICGMADHAEVREARVRELDAIIEGRAEGPTNDELIAHDAAGGGWAVRPQGFTVSVTMGGPSYTHAWRERLSTQDHPARWWPLDASGRPCAWPVATGGSGE